MKPYVPTGPKIGGYLVADIHRNENLKDPKQYDHLLTYINTLGEKLSLPVKLVRFRRAEKLIEQYKLLHNKPNIELVGPFGFLEYLRLQYHAYGVVSDSGTSQEECPLLKVPVAVPRNYTERPESMQYGNSILLGETTPVDQLVKRTIRFFQSYHNTPRDVKWLGNGRTSQTIIQILKKELAK